MPSVPPNKGLRGCGLEKGHYVYMVRCADGSLYTGWSTDPIRRERVHNSGKGARYTRARRPVRLVYAERLPDKQAALRREYAVKRLSRQEKLALIHTMPFARENQDNVAIQQEECEMPCIQTQVSVELTKEKEAVLTKRFGKAIALIPGKSESWLMLTFADHCRIAFRGDGETPAAFVEVKVLGGADRAVYEKMTAELTGILQEELGIAPDRIYIKYESTEHWGWNGGNF